MKKFLYITLLSLLSFYLFSENSMSIFLHANVKDMKNYVWDCETTMKCNENETTGTFKINQFILDGNMTFFDMPFTIETKLILPEEKGKYVIMTDNEKLNKPIKIIEKEVFTSLLESIENQKERDYIQNLYIEYRDFYLLQFTHGKSKKSIRKKVRKILNNAGYGYEKIIAWDINLGETKITGIIENFETVANLLIGDLSFYGDYGALGWLFTLDGVDGEILSTASQKKFKFGDKKAPGSMSVDLAYPVYDIDYDFQLPDLSTEELSIMLLEIFFFGFVARY